MANTILLKRSDTPSSVPLAGNLVPGEMALNYADGNLFFKDAADQIVLLSSTQLVNVSGNVTANNVIGQNSGVFGNITISGSNVNSNASSITVNSLLANVNFSINGNSTANILYVDAAAGTVSVGNSTQIVDAILTLNSTDSLVVPVGNTDQRPLAGQVGMIRFNSVDDTVEYYTTASGWKSITDSFTTIESETFFGNGYSTTFTLDRPQTTNTCIVSINGIVQRPISAYTISGDQLTFTAAPNAGYAIEVRSLATTTYVNEISNSAKTAVVEVDELGANIEITGNLIPTGNAVYSLGNATSNWQSLYVSGNTVYLGSLQLKDNSSNTFAIYANDGVTLANIAVDTIETAAISSGNSTIGISEPNGNAYVSVAGVSNVAVISSTGLVVTGSIEATNGFIGIDTAAISNGTSSFSVVTANGNIVGVVDSNTMISINSAGTLLAGNLAVTQTVTANTVIANTVVTAPRLQSAANGIEVRAAAGNNSVILTPTGTGTVDVSSKRIANVDDPVDSQDAATKRYVDEIAEGLKVKPAAEIATVAPLTATYDNGVDGVGATLTATTNGAFPEIDGVTLATTTPGENGVLVKNQSNAAENGYYLLTTVGDAGTPWVLTRCPLCDESNEIAGSYNFVRLGIINGSSGWVQVVSNPATFTIGVDPISVLQFSAATEYSAGAGLTLSGREFSVNQELTLSSITKAGDTGVGNIGSADNTFNVVFARATSALYADLAERYLADNDYNPGTVLIFGGDNEVTLASNIADTRVAGVVSSQPSYIMNSGLEGQHVATVALMGRVPCQVLGPISKGDMLIAAGDGFAMACATPSMGTVIGKALENFNGSKGVIEVVVGKI